MIAQEQEAADSVVTAPQGTDGLERRSLPLAAELEDLVRVSASIEGFLTDREVRALALFAALPTTRGAVLEIGSFRGRSTAVLAIAAGLAGQRRVVAVDPLSCPAATDPRLGHDASGPEAFFANLQRAGVRDHVEFHQTFSTDLATTWKPDRRIRLLWIDGDHTYQGAKADLEAFSPFLADGAIVAMHDVLHDHGGPARVFGDDILRSAHFGAAGFVGSIGWAQYCGAPDDAIPTQAARVDLYRRLQGVVDMTASGRELRGLAKLRYKIARSRVPHGDLDVEAWRAAVRFVSLGGNGRPIV